MTAKERVLATLRHQPTDVVPVHHVGFSSDVASALLGREAYVGGGIQQWREAVALWDGADAHAEYVERSYRDGVDLAILTGNDILRVSYWRYDRKPTRRLDDNTFLYEYGPEQDWRVLHFDPGSEQCDITYYQPPPPATFDSIAREVEASEQQLTEAEPSDLGHAFEIRALHELGEEYEIRVGGVGVGVPLRGVEVWLEAMISRPDLVARHLDVQVELAKRNVRGLAALGFRHFWGGLDFASNEGPMFSPHLFRELLIPRLQEVTDECHKYGGYHFFASDGEFWSVADMLFGDEVVDGYFEIDSRAGMTMGRLRERYPKLILIGDISSHTVHLGSKSEIVDEVMRALDVAKRSGGVVVGISNQFVPHTPIDNVMTVLETIKANR
ncbi:MAG: uroporphyrinogen decarboxylase family protein [Anaerolineae bacterium]